MFIYSFIYINTPLVEMQLFNTTPFGEMQPSEMQFGEMQLSHINYINK